MLFLWLLTGVCTFAAALAYYFRDVWRARRRRNLELRGIELLPTSIRYKDYSPLPPQSSVSPNLFRQQSTGHLSIEVTEGQSSAPLPSLPRGIRSTPSSPSFRASWKSSGQLQSRHQRVTSEPFIRLPWDERTLASSSSRRSLYEFPLSRTSYSPSSTRPSSPLSPSSEDLTYARRPDILSVGSPLVDDHASLNEEPMLIHFSPPMAPMVLSRGNEREADDEVDFLDLEAVLPHPPQAVLADESRKNDVVVHVLPAPSFPDEYRDQDEELHDPVSEQLPQDAGNDDVPSTFPENLLEDQDTAPEKSENLHQTDVDLFFFQHDSPPPSNDVEVNIVSDVLMDHSAAVSEEDLSGPDFKQLVREEPSSLPIVPDVWINEQVPVFEEDSYGPDFRTLVLEAVPSVPLVALQPGADPEVDTASHLRADYKVPAFEEDSSGPELRESVLQMPEMAEPLSWTGSPELLPTVELESPTSGTDSEEEESFLPRGSYYPSGDAEVEMVSDTISVFRSYREQVFPDANYFSPFGEDSCGPAVADPVVREASESQLAEVDVASSDAEPVFQEDTTVGLAQSLPSTEDAISAELEDSTSVVDASPLAEVPLDKFDDQNSAETGPTAEPQSTSSNADAQLEPRDSQESQPENPSLHETVRAGVENNDKHDTDDDNEQALNLHSDPSPLPSDPVAEAPQEPELTSVDDNAAVRPAWSLRAADAPPLGIAAQPTEPPEGEDRIVIKRVPSLPGTFPTQESDSSVGVSTAVETTRREVTGSQSRRRLIRSPIDIALAMQLRPGLGMGADSAWMVRFLMSMFGWFVVLLSGTGNYDGHIRPTL